LSHAKAGSQALFCSFCEGPTRAVPGALYGDGDWLAFAEIDRAVFEAGLNVAEAIQLAADLQSLLDQGEAFATVIARVIERVPALKSAKPALSNQPARGLRMLVTALTARTREDSAVSHRVPQP
jgi:hypothetical protein